MFELAEQLTDFARQFVCRHIAPENLRLGRQIPDSSGGPSVHGRLRLLLLEVYKRFASATARRKQIQNRRERLKRKYGYYCLPSNMGIMHARGHYIAHLDADNEWRPEHLTGPLRAIRTPGPDDGWPHFTYARRTYVRDHGAPPNLPEGDSPLVEWQSEGVERLLSGYPQTNFIDSSDFLIGRGTLYRLAELTGSMWNPEMRRFGDWDLAVRLMHCHFRGRAVNQVTQVYHWTGENLQLSRKVNDLVQVPTSLYEKALSEGKIKCET